MFTQTLTRRATSLLDLVLGPHGVDRYTELVDPLWTTEARGRVAAVRRQTPRSVTLVVEPNRPVPRRAGQHLSVTVEVDGRRHTRCYSPTGAQTDPLLEFTVTRHDGGAVSEYLCRHAAPGMVLGLSAAAGDFVLPDRRPARLLLVAGGSGITPVLAMLRTLAAEGHDGEVALLYYARTAEDVCHRDDLTGTRVLYGYTRAEGGDVRGRFDRGHLSAALTDPDAVYVCGPTDLVEAVRAVRPDAVAESFRPRLAAVGEGSSGGRITFGDSGIETDDDGRSILEQAEAAGLTPQHGCRMGICHTCTRRKTRGAVRNLTTGAVSAADDEDVQICVTSPVGDVEIAL